MTKKIDLEAAQKDLWSGRLKTDSQVRREYGVSMAQLWTMINKKDASEKRADSRRYAKHGDMTW